MRKFAAVITAIALTLSVAATAAAARPEQPTGTVSVVTTDAAYQQPLEVAYTVGGKYKSFYYPMVYVACYQSLDVNPYGYTTLPPNANGDYLVYGELRRVDDVGIANFSGPVFILGGGSSAWVTNGGGDADCTATLYLYPGLHDAPIIYLDQVAFSAVG